MSGFVLSSPERNVQRTFTDQNLSIIFHIINFTEIVGPISAKLGEGDESLIETFKERLV